MNSKQKNKVIDIQLGRKNIYYGLNEIKNSWNFQAVSEAVAKITNSNTRNCRIYINNLLPNMYEKLGRTPYFNYSPNDLEHELNWYVALINNHSEKINKYIKYRSVFENYLILGKYEQASEILDTINKQICVSLWGLDNQFVLAENEFGLEKNKELLANISSKDCDLWVSIYADLFSFKNEHSVNNRQYDHRLERLFTGVKEEIKSFFSEKLYPIYKISIDQLYNLLYYNECFSIIDIYNAFTKICVRAVADNKLDAEILQMIQKSVNRIKGIDDNIWEKLRFYFDADIELQINDYDKQMYIIGNFYTEGDYNRVVQECEKIFDKHANCFELYQYYVKSHIMLGKEVGILYENSIAQDLIMSMYTAYVKDKQVSQSYMTLCRIERIFSGSNFSAAISDFFVDKYMIGNSPIQNNAKEILSTFINLKLANIFNDDTSSILTKLEQTFGTGSSLELFKLMKGLNNECDNIKIDYNRYRWYKIKSIVSKDEKCDELEKWYKEICAEKGIFESYQKERISTELFYIYINERKILQAENLYVKNRLENRYSTLRMDLKEIYSVINISGNEIKKSICTPIICFLYNRNNYAEIYCHTANFMELNNLEKPSDIFARADEFEKDELIYFLKNVCTNEVLDSMYFVFDNEDQVETERIKICQFLQKLDRENEGTYIDEISHILKNKQIMQGVKYIEDVKIDLDIDKILEQHKNVFNDNFKRFKQIGDLDIEYEVIDITNNLIYVKGDSKKYSHKLIVFKEMILDFRHELAFGKYGLDQSLGTRIRHGSIQNQLRVVFEKNNIIFVKKSTRDLEYISSAKFAEICKDIDDDIRVKLYKAISDFSERIDLYLEELKSAYIQIRTEDVNPNGLIDLRLPLKELYELFFKAQSINNENLVLESIEVFWIEKIKIGLENAHEYFETTVKKRFIEFLAELEENLHDIPNIEKLHFNFYDAISRSRTEIQNSVSTVSDWFKLPTKQVYKEFSATTLVDTCETINKRVFLNYSLISVDKNINSNSKIQGKYFSYFVDILIIVFTNAYYHSGFIDNVSDLKIDLEISEKEDFLHIYVKNNLAQNVVIKDLNKKILDIQTKINDSMSTGQFRNFEGGSGLIKICKILEWNIATRWYFEFGLDDEEKHFFVKIGVYLNDIIEKEIAE